ncbi:MAG: hypothetical protein ACRDTF_21290 [Pseudonocardiaceae bacterium]
MRSAAIHSKVQGYVVTDPALLTPPDMSPGETSCVYPPPMPPPCYTT